MCVSLIDVDSERRDVPAGRLLVLREDRPNTVGRKGEMGFYGNKSLSGVLCCLFKITNKLTF